MRGSACELHIDALLRMSDSAKRADFNGRSLVTQGHFACEYASFAGETQPYPKLAESWEKWAKRGRSRLRSERASHSAIGSIALSVQPSLMKWPALLCRGRRDITAIRADKEIKPRRHGARSAR